MIKVKARGNESVEQMIRRFKKMCEKEGLTKDMKRNSYYEKPPSVVAAGCARASSARASASKAASWACRSGPSLHATR
jgi:small subunit ribosomal protein S21